MSVVMKCPNCGKSFRVDDTLVGHSVTCPCGETFHVDGIRRSSQHRASRKKSTTSKSRAGASASRKKSTTRASKAVPAAPDKKRKSTTKHKQKMKKCPICNNVVPESDIICMQCGFNFETNTRLQTREKQPLEIKLTPRLASYLGKLGILLLLALIGGGGYLSYRYILNVKPFGITEKTPLGTATILKHELEEVTQNHQRIATQEFDVDENYQIVRYAYVPTDNPQAKDVVVLVNDAGGKIRALGGFFYTPPETATALHWSGVHKFLRQFWKTRTGAEPRPGIGRESQTFSRQAAGCALQWTSVQQPVPLQWVTATDDSVPAETLRAMLRRDSAALAKTLEQKEEANELERTEEAKQPAADDSLTDEQQQLLDAWKTENKNQETVEKHARSLPPGMNRALFVEAMLAIKKEQVTELKRTLLAPTVARIDKLENLAGQPEDAIDRDDPLVAESLKAYAGEGAPSVKEALRQKLSEEKKALQRRQRLALQNDKSYTELKERFGGETAE